MIKINVGKKGTTMAILLLVVMVVLLCFGALYFYLQHNNKITFVSSILASTSYFNVQEERVNTELRVIMEQALADAYNVTLFNMSEIFISKSGKEYFAIDNGTIYDFVYKNWFKENLNRSMMKLFAEYNTHNAEEDNLKRIANDAQIEFDGDNVSVTLKGFNLSYVTGPENYVNYSFDVVYSNSLSRVGLMGMSNLIEMKKSCSFSSSVSDCLISSSPNFVVSNLGTEEFNNLQRQIFELDSKMIYFVNSSVKEIKFKIIF